MKVLRWLDKNFEKTILIMLLVAMAVIMFVQVIMRYIFGSALSWAEELTRYCFVTSTFVSIGYCIRYRSALKIDMVTSLVPARVRKIMEVVSDFLVTMFSAYFIYAASKTVEGARILNQRTAALQLPMYMMYSIICAGFCLAFIRGVQSIILRFRPEKTEEIRKGER